VPVSTSRMTLVAMGGTLLSSLQPVNPEPVDLHV
jgi:hypothetical protein